MQNPDVSQGHLACGLGKLHTSASNDRNKKVKEGSQQHDSVSNRLTFAPTFFRCAARSPAADASPLAIFPMISAEAFDSGTAKKARHGNLLFQKVRLWRRDRVPSACILAYSRQNNYLLSFVCSFNVLQWSLHTPRSVLRFRPFIASEPRPTHARPP